VNSTKTLAAEPGRDLSDQAVVVRSWAKIRRAADVLVRLMPFHAELMAQWTIKADPAVETCGVWWEQASLQLRYAPSWVDKLTLAEVCGTLVHECLHVLFGHVHVVADERTDREALLIAMETTVNEFVRAFPLPGSPLLLEQFPQLAPLQSTLVRYRLLAQESNHREGGGESVGACEDHTAASASPQNAFDNHRGWGSIQRAGAVAKLAILAATQEAVRKHAAVLEPALKRALGDADSGVGTEAGNRSERVAIAKGPRLDWQSILGHLPPAKHVARPSYSRPPRRRPELVGIIPGRQSVSIPPILLVAIDVSSSMSVAILGWIKQEVRVLTGSCRVAVVEIDVGVQRKFLLFDDGGHHPELVDDEAHGRGGTCFDAAFAPGVLSWAGGHEEVHGVLYFTDGFGPPPAEVSPVPTVWILADEHGRVRTPADWGVVVGADGRIIRAG